MEKVDKPDKPQQNQNPNITINTNLINQNLQQPNQQGKGIQEPLSPSKQNKKDGNYEKRFKIIKDMNGFTQKQLEKINKIEKIELVLEDLERMNLINQFKGLKSLTLINCGLTQIEGLEELTQLQEIWLNENKIQKIEGLQDCESLTSLFMCNNEIRQIQGLQNLKKLEVLWLCNNKIDTLQNLDSLVNLKQFWIAGNFIEEIRVSLDKLQNLNDLNISGNKICSFKEALNLNRLPNLRVLSFYDPHFGENPICNLCNYQTYVLYHLRNITKLDTLFISDDAKSYAEATFMKKKMYYNMRIKTMQRTFSTLGKLAKKARKIKLDSLNEDVANIQMKICESSDFQESLKELKEYKVLFQDKLEEIQHVEEVYESIKHKLYDVSKQSIRKLITELETGGNIRLEEGRSNEKWYMSCVDLIRSRFHAEDMDQWGISDLQIKRVVRIHNRFLRNKFEEKMESMVDVSNSNYKKSLEYLFYGIDPASPSEIYHVIEEGFRSYAENLQMKLCGFTPLVNSILGADSARLNNYAGNKKNIEKFNKKFIKKRFSQDFIIYPSGMLLICKVLMIKSIPDSQFPYFDPEVSPSEIFNKFPLNPKNYSEDSTVFRVKENDPRHKLWFFLDNNLVLPEYLIEFDYIQKNILQNKIADFNDTIGIIDNQEDEFISPKNLDIYKTELNQIYNTLCDEINNYQFENIEDINHPNLEIKAQEIDRADISQMKITLLNYFKYCLSRSSLFELNQNLLIDVQEDDNPDIKTLLKDKQAEKVMYLNISNLKIIHIQPYLYLKNLKYLILSYNKILEITNLDCYPQLTYLDISHNEILKITGIKQLKNLEILDFSHNNIEKIEDIKELEQNSSLIELKTIFNPFSEDKQVESKICAYLPQLLYLDNKKIDKTQSIKDSEKQTQIITDDLLRENGKIMKVAGGLDISWEQTLEIVNLTHCKLKSMIGLEKLENLRQLNLGHNLIIKIEGLQNCKLLEELSLEKNEISQITGLDQLKFLKKLELGKNKINKINGINELGNLMQLSLEDNEIDSLEGFPELKNLMELYLGNNRIIESKHVQALKNLSKLIILDLSGNPYSRDSQYRIYTLFVLKKLKVLDGISIEPQEQQQARDQFTGRLTEEILESRLLGQSSKDITELDLSNCQLRDFDDIFNSKVFPILSELNLSNNLFQSTKMLGDLPSLKILILNSNRIDSLYYTTDTTQKKCLNGCQALEILDISNNLLKDFNGLQFCQLRELKILKAYKNEIVKIDCLEQLKQLKELDVDHNKIRQFDAVSFVGANPIKCLKINDNGLKNFNHIQKLYKLQHLFANSNRINDIPDIERLAELQFLKELELNGNALSRRPGYRQAVLKKLTNLLYLDGKEVTIEERERIDILNGIDRTSIPSIHQPNNNQQKGLVPVKLNPINFEGVFKKN